MNAEDGVTITIDGREVSARPGTTVLEVARKLGIEIPTLCHQAGFERVTRCGLCVIEREPAELVAACETVIEAGAVYHTTSPAVIGQRRRVLKLLFARHTPDCHTCERHGMCELERLFGRLRITDGTLPGVRSLAYHDRSSPAVTMRGDRCVLCGRCVAVCDQRMGVDALQLDRRLLQARPRGRLGLDGSPCIGCGQCTLVCPAGALEPTVSVTAVEAALADRDRYCVALLEPAAAAALMTELGLRAVPRLVGVLHLLGFNAVLDAAWGADLYYGLLARRLAEEDTPRIINHCPALERHLQQTRPEIAKWLPSIDSPTRLAALGWRGQLAREVGALPGQGYLVQLATGTGWKERVRRRSAAGERGVDAALTVRELVSLLRRLRIDAAGAKPRSFLRWRGSRSAMMHGAPGATAAGLSLALAARGGMDPVDHTTAYLPETSSFELPTSAGPRKVLVAHGLPRALDLIDQALNVSDPSPPLLELYACPGGCLGGGGLVRDPAGELQQRYQALVYLAEGAPERFPQDNPSLKRLYPDLFTG